MDNFDGMSKMIILTSSIVFYAYLTEFFIAWYSDNKYEYDHYSSLSNREKRKHNGIKKIS